MKLLSKARNFRGPLDPEAKKKLAAYMANPDPSKQEWDSIAHMIIKHGSLRRATVWQAVIGVDPTFDRALPSGAKTAEDRWRRVPDGFTVARAVARALSVED